MPAAIASIETLPGSPYNGTQFVGIVITTGVTSFFKITGSNLNELVSVDWYPKNPSSVLQQSSKINLISPTEASFSIQVLNNYLDNRDRGGVLSFRQLGGTTLSLPVKNFGPISFMPLWMAPDQGLITG